MFEWLAGFDWRVILSAVGLMFALEGIFVALATERAKAFYTEAARMSTDALRTMGLWAAAIGLVVLFLVNK